MSGKHTFRIHVFTWRRAKSLTRLLDSLRDATYGAQAHIPLYIFIDGGATEQVVNVTKQFEWGHGPKRVVSRSRNVGLEENIMSCWEKCEAEEAAFFFEDDVVVSPYYFEWATSLLDTYQVKTAEGASVFGLSLAMPRVNQYVHSKSQSVF